jgi:hypothetical protein
LFYLTSTPNRYIIRIPKPPYRKKKPNIFETLDIPDERDHFDFLHEAEVGKGIRRSTQPPLTDNDLDPTFIALHFDEPKHGDYFRKYFICGEHVPLPIRETLITLIKQFWWCFCTENVQIPIKGYQCIIDTGSAKPTVARNIRYGIHGIPIMNKATNSLLKLDQIVIDEDSSWLSRIVLAPQATSRTYL